MQAHVVFRDHLILVHVNMDTTERNASVSLITFLNDFIASQHQDQHQQ